MTDIYVASAFSKNGSGGNKAGVVLEDGFLQKTDKMKLAKQLGYSETAFLSRSENADFRLEYFTPTEEVPLCGHATIGTFVVLKELGKLEKPEFTIETKSGILSIMVAEDGLIFMEQNRPVFYETLDKCELDTCMKTGYIDEKLPIQIVSTGLKDILVPVDSQIHLHELTPDMKQVSVISREKNVVGIHAFTLVHDGTVTAKCRNFAPLYGIDEESATGTSNCALACYLFEQGQRQTEYIFEQGHSLHNVSRILVHINAEDQVITKVWVGGYGTIIRKF